MILKFGKHKGQEFANTPKSYQQWLMNQDWFKMPKSLHMQLNGWDGYSKKGEAIYDLIFEQEKAQSSNMDCKIGICSCCEDSKYYGL
jgi:hypothetical protein